MFSSFILFSFFITTLSVYAAPTTIANSSTTLNDFLDSQSNFPPSQFVLAHNKVRARHNALDLSWSSHLAERAKDWANKCQFKHSGGSLLSELYGENIAAGTGLFPVPAAVEIFAQDEANYNPNKPEFSDFTQVVWNSTTQVGCGVSLCESDNIFPGHPGLGKATLYVCLYSPVGNVVGRILENVQVAQ